jgi:hypothetical protein
MWLKADVPGWSKPGQMSTKADLARKMDLKHRVIFDQIIG